MRIFRQLVKEFAGPLVGSTVWVAANFEGDLMKSATLFGGTFFFLSWLTSQFFRVKKQSATEDALINIRSDIASLLGDLKVRTNDLLGHVTGGTSFCRVELGFNSGGNCDVGLIFHHGDFALHDINVQVCDLETLDQATAGGSISVDRAFTTFPNTQLLLPGQVQMVHANISIGKRSSYRFNIFVQARNGGLTQETRAVRLEGIWVRATRVTRHNQTQPCFEQIDDLYPRAVDGTVDWR